MRKILVVAMFVFAAVPLLAATVGDDFNDNSKDTSKWGADELYGNGTLVEASQRLEYRCANGTADDDDIRPWTGSGPYSSNWEIQIDLFNNTVPNAIDQVNSFGLKIRSPFTHSNEIYVELYSSALSSFPPAVPRKGFNADFEFNDLSIGTTDIVFTASEPLSGAVRMTFDAATKVITTYYATNNHDWLEFGSYGLAGTGGSVTNADWGLSETDTIPVTLYGFSANMTVSAGQMYGDNFLATNLVGGGGGGTEHNFAILSLKVPKNINLKAAGPALTKRVKVQIQNLSDHSETISDLTTLANLVSATLSNLQTSCTPPPASLVMGPPNNVPKTLKPNGKLNVFFDLTFSPEGCVPDSAKSTKTEDHRDFSYQALVNHAALDGQVDVEPENDLCPRSPSGDDKGCGGKNQDGSLGADVKTDLYLK